MKKAIKKFRSLFDSFDLTKGDVTHVILTFMLPIVLSLFFQQIYTLTDSIIVGKTLSEYEIAGIGDSSPMVFLILYFVFGATSGFSVVTAKKFGEKNMAEVRRSVFTQIWLSLIITAILTTLGLIFLDTMLSWVGIHQSQTDEGMQITYLSARTYLLIIIGGTVTSMVYNLIVSILRSIGDSFTPFLFLVGSTILNIVLDLVLIIVFHLGVAGTAYATIFSQLAAGILCWIYAFKKYPYIVPKKEDFKAEWPFIFEHLKNGLPMSFNYSILAFGIIIMQRAVVNFDIDPFGVMVKGMPAELGYSVSNKFQSIFTSPMGALGTAMLSFTAQNLGAKNYARIREGFKKSLIIGFIIYLSVLGIGLVFTIKGAYQYIFLAKDKINALTIKYGNTYLYTAFTQSFFLMLLFIGRSVLQGLEKPLWPFLAGIGELLSRVMVCLFLPPLVAGGKVTSESTIWAYVATAEGDGAAWFIGGVLMLLIPCIIEINNLPKTNNLENELL